MGIALKGREIAEELDILRGILYIYDDWGDYAMEASAIDDQRYYMGNVEIGLRLRLNQKMTAIA